MQSNNINRISWIDCAKGIGMILVILGHTVSVAENSPEHLIRGIIFSFHMPLFFILSCITSRFSKDDAQFVRKTKRAFQHLVIPAFVLFLLRIIIYIISNFESVDWKYYLIDRINALVYSSGTNVNVAGAVIPAFGMMWFLIVLFVGRSLLDYIHLNVQGLRFVIIVLFITVLGICLGKLQWLPFSFDIALAVMIFFLYGDWLKRVDMSHNRLLLCAITFTIWWISFAIIYHFSHDYMELAGRRYPMFPICYIAAISGSMFIAYISEMISGCVLAKPIVYIGRYSLYFFCVHAMDYLYRFVWGRTDNSMVNGVIRVFIDYVLTLLLIKIVQSTKDIVAVKKTV